jgi:hypothetical protein
MTLEQTANKVIEKNQKASPMSEVFVDPATIMLICSILSMLFSALRLWITYRKNKSQQSTESQSAIEVKGLCKRKPYLLVKKTRQIVKNSVGMEVYKKHGEQIVNSVLDTCSEMNGKDIDSLIYGRGKSGWQEVGLYNI